MAIIGLPFSGPMAITNLFPALAPDRPPSAANLASGVRGLGAVTSGG